MVVKELKRLLEGVPDEMKVIIPSSMEFDGVFYSPCVAESGVSAMGTDPNLEEEDIQEMERLNKPIPEEDSFLLIPCGFGEEKDHTHELN
jgi:hypothetical protein